MFGAHRSGRPLTSGEERLVRSVFGNALILPGVRIHNRKWFWFQPRNVTMAPDGHLWFNPAGSHYRVDFSDAPLHAQGHFIHEMTHVWQWQRGLFLPLRRHPFCRYDYCLKPGWALEHYGLEQQAEIVRHAFLLRQGAVVPGAPKLTQYESVLPAAFLG